MHLDPHLRVGLGLPQAANVDVGLLLFRRRRLLRHDFTQRQGQGVVVPVLRPEAEQVVQIARLPAPAAANARPRRVLAWLPLATRP